jgi:hypothetical protein
LLEGIVATAFGMMGDLVMISVLPVIVLTHLQKEVSCYGEKTNGIKESKFIN